MMKRKKYMAFKRGMDIAISGIGLIIASPIMLLTSILIKIDSPGNVLFMQERIGKDGKVFKIAKFRSMCTGAEHTGKAIGKTFKHGNPAIKLH